MKIANIDNDSTFLGMEPPIFASQYNTEDYTDFQGASVNVPTGMDIHDLFVISAVQQSNVHELRHHLQNGCSPDACLEHPFSQYALHLACEGHVNFQIVQILLEHNADPFCKDAFNRTPLHYLTQNWDIAAANI